MQTKTRLLIGSAIGAAAGIIVGGLSAQLQGATTPLIGMGIGLLSGIPLGALLSIVPAEAWIAFGVIMELLKAVVEVLECCSVFAVFFIGMTAVLAALLFTHRVLLSLGIGASMMASLALTLLFAVLVEKRHHAQLA
ncbi:hypothetical protein [Ktedonobacter racemifer]|uniref:Cobalamin (Vitamin B12) biosynthesis CbiM protein n=1 Tax=Ktedonobacter racemifer DSM 44963 TaxID=485913 RepID=D6TTS5_KTERA|nr:hypothetical protein [Ktedonobacter racemifer]EFH83826.1 cobalamin (vitamin B12) biosynthesis CbiM protein [Ktedonobacter racemifer DSM 44963]